MRYAVLPFCRYAVDRSRASGSRPQASGRLSCTLVPGFIHAGKSRAYRSPSRAERTRRHPSEAFEVGEALNRRFAIEQLALSELKERSQIGALMTSLVRLNAEVRSLLRSSFESRPSELPPLIAADAPRPRCYPSHTLGANLFL